MSDASSRTLAQYEFRLKIAGAAIGLFTAFAGLGEAHDVPVMWQASYWILLVGAGAFLWLTVRGHKLAIRQRRRDLLELLVTGGLDRVPALDDLQAYDLGTDREAFGPDEPAPYLARDKDGELDAAIERALRAPKTSMVVLRGPSKSGKSRALYESVKRIADLDGAFVLAPHGREALARLLDVEAELSLPERAQLVLWLDDLERFVSAGQEGMTPAALDALRRWKRPVIVVATAGGKNELIADGVVAPLRQLYGDRRVTIVPLTSELTTPEMVRVQALYPDAAHQIGKHGIGEYLVAAHELARKLVESSHEPGDEPCPEGVAVVWAAIDWARSGMTGSIPDDLMKELWTHYVRGGVKPTDDNFERGLEWALKPVYGSVALVYETSSYEAYDWIVAYASAQLPREINVQAWERMMGAVDPAAAFELAVSAYQKGWHEECARAFERGTEAADRIVAANSAFNLGYVRAQRGDVDGAVTAYRTAIDAGQSEPAAMAGLNLGILLQDQGDLDAAAVAYRGAADCDATPHSGNAAMNLGLLLSEAGDVDGARAAYETAAGTSDGRLASRAEFMLGTLLAETRPAEAAAALERAVALDDPEIAPVAASLLARLVAAEPVPASAGPAFDRALRLEQDDDDVAGACAAYEQVIASGDRTLAPAATLFLGLLLKRRGEVAAARHRLEQAAAAEAEDIAHAAAAALDDLTTEGWT